MPLDEYACAVLEQDATMLTMRELFAPVRQQVAESGVSEQEVDELPEASMTQLTAMIHPGRARRPNDGWCFRNSPIKCSFTTCVYL